jgi:hypothetical protein
MGIPAFPFGKQINELTAWFAQISRFIGNDNFYNADWIPVISNFTGSPIISAHYNRMSKLLKVCIVVNGTSQTSSSVVSNLPLTAREYSVLTVYNVTDQSLVGYAYIDKNTKNIYLPDWNLASKVVVINGDCQVKGV